MRDAIYFIHNEGGYYIIKEECEGFVLGRDSRGERVKIRKDKISQWLDAGTAYLSMSQVPDGPDDK